MSRGGNRLHRLMLELGRLEVRGLRSEVGEADEDRIPAQEQWGLITKADSSNTDLR